MAGQVVSRAVVVATSVTLNGDREVLGCAVGDSADEACWSEFLRGLRERGLRGVRLVISDHHLGLKRAISSVLIGVACERCRVHFVLPDIHAGAPLHHQFHRRNPPARPYVTPGGTNRINDSERRARGNNSRCREGPSSVS